MSVTKVFWMWENHINVCHGNVTASPNALSLPFFFHVSMIDPSAIDDIRCWLYVFHKSL